MLSSLCVCRRRIISRRGKYDVSGLLSLRSFSPPSTKLIAREFCTKLFVGGLSYDSNEPVLKDAFGEHGEILRVKVICDHKTSKSKGYGFVQFRSESDASMALQKMNGQLLDNRNIRVHYANGDAKAIGNVQDE